MISRNFPTLFFSVPQKQLNAINANSIETWNINIYWGMYKLLANLLSWRLYRCLCLCLTFSGKTLNVNSSFKSFHSSGQTKIFKKSWDIFQKNFLDIHGPCRINPDDFGYHVTFLLVPKSGQNSLCWWPNTYKNWHSYQPQLYFVFSAN